MNTKLAELMRAMVSYDHGDVPRIQHSVKVHDFAATILHDIGIHPAEAKYGNSNGKAQEELGPGEARKVLQEVGGFTDAQIDRICWLIGHHHTYSNVTSADHRILLEADFLVNSFEDHLSLNGIKTFRDNVFRSAYAIELLNKMWGIEEK